MENNKRSAWTRKDEVFVRENPNMAIQEIAGLLGRTVQAVTVRKSKLRTTGTKHFAPQGGRKAAGAVRHKPTKVEVIESSMDRYQYYYVGMGIIIRSDRKLGWFTRTILMLKEGE